jgi:hypothetical protein
VREVAGEVIAGAEDRELRDEAVAEHLEHGDRLPGPMSENRKVTVPDGGCTGAVANVVAVASATCHAEAPRRSARGAGATARGHYSVASRTDATPWSTTALTVR